MRPVGATWSSGPLRAGRAVHMRSMIPGRLTPTIPVPVLLLREVSGSVSKRNLVLLLPGQAMAPRLTEPDPTFRRPALPGLAVESVQPSSSRFPSCCPRSHTELDLVPASRSPLCALLSCPLSLRPLPPCPLYLVNAISHSRPHPLQETLSDGPGLLHPWTLYMVMTVSYLGTVDSTCFSLSSQGLNTCPLNSRRMCHCPPCPEETSKVTSSDWDSNLRSHPRIHWGLHIYFHLASSF